MGFDGSLAREALQRCSGVLQEAVQLLLESPEGAPLPPPSGMAAPVSPPPFVNEADFRNEANFVRDVHADEEEQLAIAMALSAQIAEAAPPPPAASSFGLRMAEAAEAQALRESEAAEQQRLRARVEPGLLRVAGDAKGTASTLVGLSPEEAEELAMLQSRVAAEQPPERPKAHQLVHSAGAAVATPTLHGHLAPMGTLPALQPGALAGGALPAVAPPAVAAPSGRAKVTAKGGKKGQAGGLQESLLGGDFMMSDEMGLAPLQMPALAPLQVHTPAAIVPAVVPMTAPQPAQPQPQPARRSPFDDEEWDDADRPLQLSQLPSRAGGGQGGGAGAPGGNVWGV